MPLRLIVSPLTPVDPLSMENDRACALVLVDEPELGRVGSARPWNAKRRNPDMSVGRPNHAAGDTPEAHRQTSLERHRMSVIATPKRPTQASAGQAAHAHLNSIASPARG